MSEFCQQINQALQADRPTACGNYYSAKNTDSDKPALIQSLQFILNLNHCNLECVDTLFKDCNPLAMRQGLPGTPYFAVTHRPSAPLPLCC